MKKSRFQRNPPKGPNIHLQTSQTECFQTAVWKQRLNSVSGTHTTQSGFWEWFSLVFIRGYFLFYRWPKNAWNLHMQIPQKEGFQSALSKGRFNSVSWTHTNQRTFWEFFLLALDEEIPLPTKSSKRSKYPLADFTEYFQTALWKGKLNSVSGTHTSPSGCWAWFSLVFYEDICFSTVGPEALEISTCKFHKKRASILLSLKEGSTLWVEHMQPKEVTENSSVSH